VVGQRAVSPNVLEYGPLLRLQAAPPALDTHRECGTNYVRPRIKREIICFTSYCYM